MGNADSKAAPCVQRALRAAGAWEDSCGRVYRLEHKVGPEGEARVRGATDALRVADLLAAGRAGGVDLDMTLDFDDGTLLLRERPQGPDWPRTPPTSPDGALPADLADMLRSATASLPSRARDALDPVVAAFARAVAEDGSLRVLALVVAASFDGEAARAVVSGLRTVRLDELRAAIEAGADAAGSTVHARQRSVTLRIVAPAAAPRAGEKRKRAA